MTKILIGLRIRNRMCVLKKLFSALFLLIVLAALYWAYQVYIGGNFHTVIDGELYRSAQPTAADIRKYQEKYGIKTIINMRGQRPGKDWYEDEIKTSTKLGIVHYDWAFSSTLKTPLTHMDHVMWLMKNAEKPILIHCMAGADRTGLGVAVYLYGIKNIPAKEAKNRALSVIYGYFPYLWSETDSIGESFDKFARADKKGRGLK